MSGPLALFALFARTDQLPLVRAASDALLGSALAGAVVIAAVWLLCRLAPSVPPRVRSALWWTACLKLLVGCVWLAPVELPLLPAPEAATVLAAVSPEAPPEAALAPTSGLPAWTAGEEAPAPLPWRTLVLLVWAAGVAAGISLDLRALRRLRRTLREARPVIEGPAAELLTELALRLGLRSTPRLLVSDTVATPQAAGLVRPAVLLPTAALGAPREELAMVVAHELIHLRRRDLWLAWVPLLARRIFFFHPLAPLAGREHALAREAACDAEVLDTLGTAPRVYGRLLVRWGVAPRETGLAAAGAAPSVLILKRRLKMLHDSSTTKRRSSPWWWLAAAGLALALVPVTIVAQAPPAPPEAPAPPAEVAPPAPPSRPVLAAAPSAPAPAAPPAVAPAPSPAPAPAPAPVSAPPAPPAPPEHAYTWSWSDDGDGFALLDQGSSVWIQGTSGSSERVRAVRKGDEPLLWFRRDGGEYVVRDRALIERARTILGPQMELGEQQGELGGRQGELGGEQGELGRRQGELGAKQGALGAQQAELAAKQMALAGQAAAQEEGDTAELHARRAELERRMRELAVQQRTLAEQQRELGGRQRALGERQRELGERQRALAERQREAAERARGEIEDLIDDAITSGKAERID